MHYFISLEKCCHVQLMADAAASGNGGATVKIGEAEAEETYRTVGTGGWFSGRVQFQALEMREGSKFDFN